MDIEVMIKEAHYPLIINSSSRKTSHEKKKKVLCNFEIRFVNQKIVFQHTYAENFVFWIPRERFDRIEWYFDEKSNDIASVTKMQSFIPLYR